MQYMIFFIRIKVNEIFCCCDPYGWGLNDKKIVVALQHVVQNAKTTQQFFSLEIFGYAQHARSTHDIFRLEKA